MINVHGRILPSSYQKSPRATGSNPPRIQHQLFQTDHPTTRTETPPMSIPSKSLVACLLFFITAALLASEPDTSLDGKDGRNLTLDRFRPVPMLKVAAHLLTKAKYPVVDVHVHPRIRLHSSPELLAEYVKLMDAQNIAVSVSLDGGMGDAFLEHRKYLWTDYRDRFVIFANIDWRGQASETDYANWDCHRPDFARRMATELATCKQLGASGVKIFKNFGLEYRNPDGSLVKIDDPRWEPIWTACGELGLPVLIHVADPKAFFLPIDNTNERWEELRRHPEWSFYGPQFPAYSDLTAAFLRVVKKHPKTTFIGAHMTSSSEDLGQLAVWLDACPNLYVDLAARIAELGRQPFTARKFCIRYADRMVFGTDGPRVPERLLLHWRFLETEDEYFPYAENPFPPQGFWRIYGIHLPDDVLRKIYSENAARIIPGVKSRLNGMIE
jgi:predicted TIM-barrel fold metal-dependent hydrolase